ncbi:hypothetical protein A2U01_0061569, partial [Trifolium medium]|nr:hypothetical protein [Trifolium medium]
PSRALSQQQKVNCPCTIALRVAPAQVRALRQRQKAKPPPQFELRVALLQAARCARHRT